MLSVKPVFALQCMMAPIRIFFTKNQNERRSPDSIKKIIIPSLKETLGPDLLRPVTSFSVLSGH